jgi:hypothetical protein
MRLLFPRPGAKAVRDDMFFAVDWNRWFQRLWTSFGWNPSSRMYDDLHPAVWTWSGSTELTFTNGNNDSMSGTFHLPSTYVQGTALYPYAVVVGSSGTGAAASLTFTGEVLSVGDADGAGSGNTKTPTLDNVVSVVEFDAVGGTAGLRNDIVDFTLARASSDSYGGDVRLLSVGLKIAKQGVGQEVRFPT